MFHIKTDDSITVVVNGRPYTVSRGNERYDIIAAAINENDAQAIDDIINYKEKLIAKFGDVSVFGGHVMYRDEPITNYLVQKIMAGGNIESLGHFLDKVSPADVVAFPTDYNLSKARCCRYEVLQEVPGAQFFEGHEGLTWEAEPEPEPEPEQWVIINEQTDQFWSETDRWVDSINQADAYTYQYDDQLPIGGRWEANDYED